jgi:hypothetical protein
MFVLIPHAAVMSLEFEHGVLFRARTGATELFDSPLSRRSARDVARLLARRWSADVEVVPCAPDGSPLGEPADAVSLLPRALRWR